MSVPNSAEKGGLPCAGWDSCPNPEHDHLCDPDDAPMVCIEHGAFVPCRKAGWHYHSQNPYWVKAVRDYQSSTVEGLTWEPASEYAARKIAHPLSCGIVGPGGSCDCAAGREAVTQVKPPGFEPNTSDGFCRHTSNPCAVVAGCHNDGCVTSPGAPS